MQGAFLMPKHRTGNELSFLYLQRKKVSIWHLMVEQLSSIDCVHYNVGKEVRTAIEKIGGTMPEDLPTPEKSIQQIEKEQMARLTAKAKKGKIMLDE